MSKPIENAILQKTPEPSQWLGKTAKDHFKYIVPLLIKDGVVCSVDVPVIEVRQKLMQVFHSGRSKAFWRAVGSVQLVGQIGYQIDKLHSQRLFGFLPCLRHEFLELGHFLLIQRGREYS